MWNYKQSLKHKTTVAVNRILRRKKSHLFQSSLPSANSGTSISRTCFYGLPFGQEHQVAIKARKVRRPRSGFSDSRGNILPPGFSLFNSKTVSGIRFFYCLERNTVITNCTLIIMLLWLTEYEKRFVKRGRKGTKFHVVSRPVLQETMRFGGFSLFKELAACRESDISNLNPF